ncbi:TetR/AcrR family transcriptional regulator [Sinosporangium siamense]|nr:TetR/AcrR family transcriptional regulator [Sinosporangium siamense]
MDRRVRRTRQAVQRALVDLTLEKGYEAVTVTDLINRADVGRSTFYAHFTDKQDVLLSNIAEIDFLHRPPSTSGELFAFSLPMLEHAAEQQRLVKALLGRRGGGVLVARGEQMLATMIRDELTTRGAPASPSLDLVVICVAGAFMALLRQWVDGDFTATPTDLDTAFRTAVIPGVAALLGGQ